MTGPLSLELNAANFPLYYDEVLPPFRAGQYEVARPRFEEFFTRHAPQLTPRAQATLRFNLIACHYGCLARDGELERRSPDGRFPAEWAELWSQVEAYLELLAAATDWPVPPTVELFGNLLDLLVAFEAELPRSLQALAARIPPRYQPAWLEALRQQLLREAINFERTTQVAAVRALGELFLHATADQPGTVPARVAVLIRLADLLFFRGDAGPELAGPEAIGLLDQALALDPAHRPALRLREHILQREATVLQIERFRHDTSSRLGSIHADLERLRAAPELDARLRPAVARLEQNFHAISAVGDLVQLKTALPRPVDPAEVVRQALAERNLPEDCLVCRGAPAAWEIVPGYLALALENLLKNSEEAYARRRLPRPPHPVQVLLDYGAQTLEIRDQAGGLASGLRDPFLPHVSEKGFQQGAGLGLYQAREAIRLAAEGPRLEGGALTLAPDQPPGGAAFRIWLPVGYQGEE